MRSEMVGERTRRRQALAEALADTRAQVREATDRFRAVEQVCALEPTSKVWQAKRNRAASEAQRARAEVLTLAEALASLDGRDVQEPLGEAQRVDVEVRGGDVRPAASVA